MKKINILVLMILFSCSLFAKKVDIETAKSIAKNYYALQAKEIKGLIINTPVISETIKLNRGKADLIYVFNFENGFVMISADDAFKPILGFSIEGKYSNENQPPAFTELIEGYKDRIINVNKSNPVSVQEVTDEWKHYLNLTDHNARVTASDDCIIWPKFFTKDALLTTSWAQTCYYNEKCPYDARSYCGRVPAGCVAVAMAQVMKYWNYPATGASSHGYTDSWINPDGYGYLSANFGATTYNWASMPNSITSNSDPIATLMYHCGVSVDMDYGYAKSYIGNTGVKTTMRNSLINYFKYSPASQFIENIAGSNQNTWESTLINELTNNRPIIYAGTSNSKQDHVFVLDGYTKMQTECCTYSANFHVNWGWGGSGNGYYLLSDMDYNYAQAALIGIKPSSYSYPVPAQPSYISEGYCSPHCQNSSVDYFVPTVVGAAYYEWKKTDISGISISVNGRYATIWGRRFGTGTIWCRAVNSNGVAGPWQTRSITISNCLGRSSNENDNDQKTVTENQVYPNPASNSIYLNLPDPENYTKAELLDLQGKVLKTVLIDNENTVIKTEDINNGLYLIKLISNQGIELKKISILK